MQSGFPLGSYRRDRRYKKHWQRGILPDVNRQHSFTNKGLLMRSADLLNKKLDLVVDKMCKILNRTLRQELQNKKRIQKLEKIVAQNG